MEGERCHGNCIHADLQIDLDKEVVIRTCRLSGKEVPVSGRCEQWSLKFVNYNKNPAVIDSLENRDVSEIIHYV